MGSDRINGYRVSVWCNEVLGTESEDDCIAL